MMMVTGCFNSSQVRQKPATGVLLAKRLFVSIPHRYARNDTGSPERCLGAVFQFLIGTLETELKAMKAEEEAKFQFLIGTLETAQLRFWKMWRIDGFNSSQVRQKRYRCNPGIHRISVSIPHRYARNGGFKMKRYVVKQVSIPHRYARNEQSLRIFFILVQFQFLIGTLETQGAQTPKERRTESFNSSQVRQKPAKPHSGDEKESMRFNSSQVRQKRL